MTIHHPAPEVVALLSGITFLEASLLVDTHLIRGTM